MVGKRLTVNERGFSIVESALVFVVIILLATAAGIVANKQNGSQAQLNQNVVQLGTEPSVRNSNPKTTTLELSSLGIDISIPNQISDLTYASPNASGGYGISTKTLTAKDANCVATGNAAPLGYFYREPGAYPGPSTAPGQLARQFVNFYIAWSAPKASCSGNSSVSLLANQQMQFLVQAFGTIEEIPPGNASD